MEDENYFNSHEENMIVYENTTFIIHRIWGMFWNPLYGHPWIVPKTISKITISFSSLTTSFLS
jgi:hypothetical protein